MSLLRFSFTSIHKYTVPHISSHIFPSSFLSISLPSTFIPIRALNSISSFLNSSSPPSTAQMATYSLQSLHSLLNHHHPSDTAQPSPSPPSTTTTTLFLNRSTAPSPTSLSSSTMITTPPTSTTTTFSLSSTASSSSSPTSNSSSQPISFDVLEQHLSAQNLRQADEETRRLLIVLAGEAAVKRGYVFFSEVQFIAEADLKAIDELWRKYSDNKFGYSVQKKIWQKVNKDFTGFFLKVGWMKKLDTEVVQYNYRSFPNEFMWELSKETPEGHLPLTNALRGTQLLNCILSHPAFEGVEEEREEKEGKGQDEAKVGDNGVVKGGSKPLTNRVLKPNYGF